MAANFASAILVTVTLLGISAVPAGGYQLSHGTFSAGGGLVESVEYSLQATVSEPVIGITSDSNYLLEQGFWFTIEASGATSSTPPLESPSFAFRLGQNSPNPFSFGTTIRYQLPSNLPVRLEVINALGRRVATILDGEQAAGEHVLNWDGANGQGRRLPSGVYTARLTALGMTRTIKMTLTR